MLKQQIVDGQIPFDSSVWKKKWFEDTGETNNDSIIIRNSRCITGIDPFKFSQYSIYFYESKKDVVVNVITAVLSLGTSIGTTFASVTAKTAAKMLQES